MTIKPNASSAHFFVVASADESTMTISIKLMPSARAALDTASAPSRRRCSCRKISSDINDPPWLFPLPRQRPRSLLRGQLSQVLGRKRSRFIGSGRVGPTSSASSNCSAVVMCAVSTIALHYRRRGKERPLRQPQAPRLMASGTSHPRGDCSAPGPQPPTPTNRYAAGRFADPAPATLPRRQ